MKYAIVAYAAIGLAVFLGLLICRYLKKKKVLGLVMFGDDGGIGEILAPALLWPVWLLLIVLTALAAMVAETAERIGKK